MPLSTEPFETAGLRITLDEFERLVMGEPDMVQTSVRCTS
jgi:hypothetical protein